MAKTKAELLKQLIDLGYTEQELDGKTKVELEKVLETHNQERESEEVVQDVPKEEQEPVEPQSVSEDANKQDSVQTEPLGDVIATEQLQLRVHDTRVLNLYTLTKAVLVENIGGGDAYVSGDPLRLTQHNIIRPGESKVFKDTKALIVRASSRPTLKITQYK